MPMLQAGEFHLTCRGHNTFRRECLGYQAQGSRPQIAYNGDFRRRERGLRNVKADISSAVTAAVSYDDGFGWFFPSSLGMPGVGP